MSNSQSVKRWPIILGAVFIQFCLAALYAWAVFTPELIEQGWSRLDTQFVFATGLATFALVTVFADHQLKRWGPRKLAIMAGVLLGCVFVFTRVERRWQGRLFTYLGGTIVLYLAALSGLYFSISMDRFVDGETERIADNLVHH